MIVLTLDPSTVLLNSSLHTSFLLTYSLSILSSSSSLQPLGSLSSNGTFFTYDVPTKEQLENEVVFVNNSANITAKFTLLQSEVSLYGCVYVCHMLVCMCVMSLCLCVP